MGEAFQMLLVVPALKKNKLSCICCQIASRHYMHMSGAGQKCPNCVDDPQYSGGVDSKMCYYSARSVHSTAESWRLSPSSSIPTLCKCHWRVFSKTGARYLLPTARVYHAEWPGGQQQFEQRLLHSFSLSASPLPSLKRGPSSLLYICCQF